MVICQECGKSFSQITNQHLKFHQTTIPEYKIKYPDFPISSESFKAKQKFKKVNVFNDPPVNEPLTNLEDSEIKSHQIQEEIKIEETNEFDLDKIPVVSKEFANEVSNFIEEVKSFTEENKIKFPDPKNIIHKEKLKILNPDELLEKGYVVKDPDEIRKSKAKNVIIVLFLAIVIVLLILLSLK